MADPSSARRRAIPVRLVRSLAAAVGTLALVLGPSVEAAAHTALFATAPVADATVPSPPEAVTLEFTDPPQSLGTQVTVTAPDGAAVAAGAPVLDGATVVQPLADRLPAGSYRVDWQVTAADGHPLAGAFRFTVGAAAAGTAGTTPATTGIQDTETATAGATDGGPSFPAVWLGVAVAVAAAGLVIRQLRRPA